MNPHHLPSMLLVAIIAILVGARASVGAELSVYVSPSGDDQAAGTQAAPFRTLHRAQEAVRVLAKSMTGDVTVNLAPGDYRIDHTLAFTPDDSGRNGFRLIWRSEAGPGKARLLGSVPSKGWQPYRDGIWKIELPPKMVFHTLYENGQRAHKARFPDWERDAQMPVALGSYLVSVDGTPKQNDKGEPRPRGPGWLAFRPEDTPPVTDVTKMRLHIFPGGKCDWVREVHAVTAIDPQTHRLTFDVDPVHGVGVGARFFLEDELGFLNAPGEFFLDETTRTLYYFPLGKGHPDTLGIAFPVINRLIQFKGQSRENCVQQIVLDGLTLEETDNTPPQPLWAYDGHRDGALVWMNNTARIEIRNCHLRNSGRSGILLIGHNLENQVNGCSLEHLGLNGISLCNRFSAPGGKEPTSDRCEGNRIHNTRISHVGELYTYAECITLFNVSNNEVDHCELSHSVRYAVTLRGNTGIQYGPPVSTPHPPTRNNRIHHVRVFRCGQDGGDMGALHTAALNNPGGGAVNVFEQITVADTAAIPSVQDIAPDGIFLDWPKMSMDQVFRNVEIIRSQGIPFRSHGLDNGASTQTENVTWKPGFDPARMDYANIGLTPEFPIAFGGQPAQPSTSVAPAHLRGKPTAHDQIKLEWDAVTGPGQPLYRITRNGQEIACVTEPRWVDRRLKECATYHYQVAARPADFTHFSTPASCEVATPPDRKPPTVTAARISRDGKQVRIDFNEPVDAEPATTAASYRLEPARAIQSIHQVSPAAVELLLGSSPQTSEPILFVQGISDTAAAKNRIGEGKPVPVKQSEWTVRYAMDPAAGSKRLEDVSAGGADALLRGGAAIEAGAGPHGEAALVLDGIAAFAEAPSNLNLGPGDFTFAVWAYSENSGVILSKGTDFAQPEQWSFGSPKEGVPGSVSLRIANHYFPTGERSIKLRQWTHLTFVRKGKQGFSYINGLPSGGPHDLSEIKPLVNDRALRLGRREYEKNPVYFKGRISGLTIWPRALSPEAVRRETTRQNAE